MSTAQEICERYKCGHHIHIGHPDDHLKDHDEREREMHAMRAGIDLIIQHEMKRGGISKGADGLLVFHDPGVIARFPRVRDASNINCCCAPPVVDEEVPQDV